MGFASLGRRTTVALLALVAGNVLFLAGWGTLYDVALVYTLAVALPYPAVARSLIARLAIGFVLLYSLLQVAGIVQFFVFPASDFRLLSVLVTGMVFGLVWALRRSPQRFALCIRDDVAGVVTALFFVIPFSLMCFWQNDPARLVAFASVQGADGANHYTMIGEMASTQHLDYREATYYPKGFHVASAFLLDGLHANQRDLSWLANARVYAGLYAVWGAVLAYVVGLFAVQLREALAPRSRPSRLLVACAIGPVLALLYLFLFTQQGFLSYFYIVAAVVCGIMYVQDVHFDRAGQWPLVAYLLLAFGVAASWGPLLTPALLLVPVLIVWPYVKKRPSVLFSPQWRWATVAFAAQLLPLYVHIRYARLSSQQGLNATGGLTTFHYGIVLADLALLAYALCGRKVPKLWREFAGDVVLPFLVLLGVIIGFQYVTVGELRYYAIKTAFLLEILLLPIGALLLGAALKRSNAARLRQWLAMPVIFGLSAIILCGITASPFNSARILFGTLARGSHRTGDVQAYTGLGLRGQLATNTVDLHISQATGALGGNAVLNNWANLMQYTPENTPQSSQCNSRIFALETAASVNDQSLVSAVKDCTAAASARGEPLIVMTDAASVVRVRQLLGNANRYVY